MRLSEILLSKNSSTDIDALKDKVLYYVDKLLDPSVTSKDKSILRKKINIEIGHIKQLIVDKRLYVNEAISKIPLSNSDFDSLIELFDNPVPAIVADLYISDVIQDDELSDQINYLAEKDPARDIRPLIMDWVNTKMPDQMYRFRKDTQDERAKHGLRSVIQGEDPPYGNYNPVPVTGNAYGRF